MEKERSEKIERLGVVQVSSEPCKPTTSACARAAHFVLKKKKEDVRTAVVPVRFTPGERTTVKCFAEARRLSLSEFIRTVVLSRKLRSAVPPEINRSAYQQLGRVGNNLNQLVRAVNSGIVKAVDSDLLHQLAAEVRRLGATLVQGRG